MRRKIILSLFALLMFFSFGSVIAVLYIANTTAELKHIIKLHEVEQLRRSLVINLQTVQSNLLTVNTPFAKELDSIAENVTKLEGLAEKCSSCHHPPRLSDRIRNVQSLITDYETNISYFITARANSERVKKLKEKAAAIGNKLILITEDMSHGATVSLEEATGSAMEEINDVKDIIFVTIIITILLSFLVAIRLTKSVTRPVHALVKATRMISSGKFGSVISYIDNTEFGELASHFNAMSIAVKNGYEKIQQEMRDRWQTEAALIKSEKFLNTIFDSIHDPFCIFDEKFEVVRANDAYAQMKNRTINDLVGKKCHETLHGRSTVCEGCIVEKTFLSDDPCAKDKYVILEDGSKVWYEIYTYPIFNEKGRVSHVIEYTRDITDRKLTEEALRESEERYMLASQGANDGLWDWNIRYNVIYYSPRWKSMLGYSEDAIGNSPDEWLGRVHADDRVQVEAAIAAHIDGHNPNLKSEFRIVHKDGSYRWVLSRGLAVRDGSARAYRMAGSMTDITERKEAEAQLLFDAFHDALTGLPNRALFMDRLGHAVNREIRHSKYLFAVLFLDMDRFKILNDSLGHTIGDQMLIDVSHRLQESLRPGDTVARMGGDEFAVLLEDLKNREEALVITERIRDKLSSSFNLNGQEVFTSASIGIAFSTTEYDKPENLLRNADIAMYHAKSNGSDRYEVFDTKMYANAVARLKLETDLRQAINQNEFEFHYQPIVSMKAGRIVGIEALIRWKHPVRGLIYPEEFIPIAEETGLICSIGEWALQQACRQLQAWHKAFPSNPPLDISVNISSRQFLPRLIEQIRQALDDTGLRPDSLVLEITESMIMENADMVAPLLTRLKEMHVKLFIDDFGTGYSSLSYLHYFPVDVLKIDRSFITRLGYNGENLEIVKAITTLAHSLHMDVIAEGVETEHQFMQLMALKCRYMQGYFFSKPVNKEGIESLLRQGNFDLTYLLTRTSDQ